jgi:hypothetical protein
MERNKELDSNKDGKTSQPDKETLHKTDPQENMDGPMSSPTRQTGELFDSDENKEEADERRNERM